MINNYFRDLSNYQVIMTDFAYVRRPWQLS